VGLDLAAQRLLQWCIGPLPPADEALQGQTGLTTTRGNRCDVFVCNVRQQTTDRGFGVLSGDLPLEGVDKGRHKGVQAWDDLLEDLRSHLTFVKQWGFAKGVSRFHGTLLL
jgi:hypothetical protein